PFIGVVILIALHTLYADILRGLQYIFEAIAPTDLLRPVLTLVIVALGIFLFEIPPLHAALFAFVLSIALVLLYQLIIVVRTIYRKPSFSEKARYHVRDWLQFGLESLFFRGTIILR